MIKNKFAKLEVKMSHSYELFLAGSSLNTEDIQTLTLKMANHIGAFGKYNFWYKTSLATSLHPFVVF